MLVKCNELVCIGRTTVSQLVRTHNKKVLTGNWNISTKIL